MTKSVKNIAVLILLLFFVSSCCPTKCVIYDLTKYKVDNTPYIPIYNPVDSEWIKAEHILKDIVAPAKWGSKRHQFCGLEYMLYIRTTYKNQKKISNALPTLWKP